MRERNSNQSLLMQEVNDRVFKLLTEDGPLGQTGSEEGKFLCECSDEGCIETMQLTLREYAALQTTKDRPPLKLPGHPD